MLITAPLGTLTTWAAPSIQPPTSACTQQLPSHPAQPTPLHTNSPTGASLSHSLHSTLSTHIQHILSLPWSLAKTIHPIQHHLARNTSSSALPTFLPAHTHTHTHFTNTLHTRTHHSLSLLSSNSPPTLPRLPSQRFTPHHPNASRARTPHLKVGFDCQHQTTHAPARNSPHVHSLSNKLNGARRTRAWRSTDRDWTQLQHRATTTHGAILLSMPRVRGRKAPSSQDD